ncbi:MAG: hypothetical protein WKF96_14290 [Solirubrobacteraceae bacterium]
MPSWNQDSDRALDAELRAARPEPSAEVTRAIADRVRPRQAAGTRRFGRLQLALAGGLTALVLTPVVATGAGGFGSFGKSTAATTKSSASYKAKARSGRAAGVLSASRKRALRNLSRRAGARPAIAGLAPAGGDAALAAQDSPSAFFGDIFRPQNDLSATQVEYGIACNIDVLIQENDVTLTQGGNTATGGDATATGGDGGDANTGNTQTNTGGATGGDTTATSGNATGGNGGNATATGGSAVAGNVASQTVTNLACVPVG